MKILEKIKNSIDNSNILSKYIKNFNDIIIDITKNSTLYIDSIMCNVIPTLFKLENKNKKFGFSNISYYDTIEDLINNIQPDNNIKLLIADNLDFLKSKDFCNLLATIEIPIILTQHYNNFTLKSEMIFNNIKYSKSKELSKDLLLYLPNNLY